MAAKTVICLDLDGTLADSIDAHVQAYNLAFRKNGLPAKSRREITATFGQPAGKIIKHLFPKTPNQKLFSVLKDKHEFFLKETYKLVRSFGGIANALEKLKEKYILALISNAAHEEIVKTLKQVKISKKLFDTILGEGEFEPKPSPEFVKKVENKIGRRVEFVVGDTIYDIKSGKAAHVKTIAVLSGVQDIKTLGAEDPTMIIKSVAVLPEILEGDLMQ